MAQLHMDRLSALDVSFLTNESSSSHMHVGGICIFEGPPMDYVSLLEHVRSRLHLVPRFRQKLAFPPAPTGRPFWVDDPAFNLEYHVRHSALPAPGSEEQLRNMAARVFSQQLDRTKPLWELWMVQGLTRKRFAFVTKTHHALVDGISGVDIATVLFDLKPVPEPAEADHDWVASPTPSAAELLARDAEGVLRTPLRVLRRTQACGREPANRDLPRPPRPSRRSGRSAGTSPTRPRRCRSTSRSAHIGDFAGFAPTWRSSSGSRARLVAPSTMSSSLSSPARCGAGFRPAEFAPRASSCAPRCRYRFGAQISTASSATSSPRSAGPFRSTSRTRSSGCEVCRKGMEGIKQSKQALGAEVISRFNDFAPPTLLAQAARVNFSTRLFNLVVTNVPGPQIPLYVLGRELEDIFPVGFLPPNHALFVAIMSYNGGVNFGLLADYDAIPDIDVIAEGIEASIAELLDAAADTERESRDAQAAPA